MPGIHVRTFGQSDWIQQAGGTALTVPGSYWLCHKNNIYKFTFKYHRADRNTEEFNYGRDLIKIMRKVIKCQPKPGQQLTTSHLLVTCNHTGWTRQDKIFAILKFKERPKASAFTHAFVLTVKLTATTDFFADSVTDNERGPEPLYLTNRIASNKAQHTCKTETSTADAKEDENNIQITSIGTTLPKTITTISSTSMLNNESSRMHKESVLDCDSTRKRDIQFNGETSDRNVKRLATPSKLGKKRYTETNKKKKINKSQDCSAVDNLTESERNIEDNPFTDILPSTSSEKQVDGTSHRSDFNYRKDPMQNIENTERNSKHTIDEGNLDSVSLPYQYLIEKEIEKSKHNRCTRKFLKEDDTTKSDINVLGERIESSRILHNPIENTNADEQKVKTPDSNDKKQTSNDRVHRSSNITDLVMEGLMFTIREDKDSVAVIEQKTKLELDEVLENSEKVETKEGEKCLKNSSLLGLENLITKIDSPSHSVEKRKLNNVQITDSFPDEKLLIESCTGLTQTISNMQNNLTNRLQDTLDSNIIVPSTNRRHGTDQSSDANENCMMTDEEDFTMMLDDDKEDTEAEQDTENEEDEDIVPEALQTVVDKSSAAVDARLCLNGISASNSEFDRDLLMDDIETDGNQRNPTTLITNKSFKAPHRPRIISNEIITVDQIPPALQVVLKNKLMKHSDSRASKIQSFEEDCTNDTSDLDPLNKSITHSRMEMQEDKTMELASATTESTDINENSTENNQINIPVSINVKPNDINNCNHKHDNDSNIQQHRLTTQTLSIRELKRLAPTGLQDITEDFYQNLLQMQKGSNSIDHRSLRQRRKTGTINNSKNEEIRVEILKFIRDITLGAKVVLTRISTKTIANILEKSASV